MCIIEGDKIYKYVGNHASTIMQLYVKCTHELNTWYPAEYAPTFQLDFELVGEM